MCSRDKFEMASLETQILYIRGSELPQLYYMDIQAVM